MWNCDRNSAVRWDGRQGLCDRRSAAPLRKPDLLLNANARKFKTPSQVIKASSSVAGESKQARESQRRRSSRPQTARFAKWDTVSGAIPGHRPEFPRQHRRTPSGSRQLGMIRRCRMNRNDTLDMPEPKRIAAEEVHGDGGRRSLDLSAIVGIGRESPGQPWMMNDEH